MKTNRAIQNVLAVLVIIAARGSAQNIVTNGSFEAVQIGPPYESSDPANVPGWTHTGGGDGPLWHVGYFDSFGSITVAGDGLQFVTLGGGYESVEPASWSQVLNGLTPGSTYQLAFKMAGEANFEGTNWSFTVAFPSGSSTPPQTFSAATPATNYWTQWESKSMTFIATNNQVELVFTNNAEYDVGLDSVSVTLEPTLYISQSNATVTVLWQNVSGWNLQTNSNLSTPANWSQDNNWATSNGTNYLNLTPPTGNLFFRLKQ